MSAVPARSTWAVASSYSLASNSSCAAASRHGGSRASSGVSRRRSWHSCCRRSYSHMSCGTHRVARLAHRMALRVTSAQRSVVAAVVRAVRGSASRIHARARLWLGSRVARTPDVVDISAVLETVELSRFRGSGCYFYNSSASLRLPTSRISHIYCGRKK